MRAQYKIFQRVIDDYISERFDCGHILFFYSEAFSLIANSRCGYEIDVYMLQICLCYAIVAWICRRQQRWTTATGKMKFNRKKDEYLESLFFHCCFVPASPALYHTSTNAHAWRSVQEMKYAKLICFFPRLFLFASSQRVGSMLSVAVRRAPSVLSTKSQLCLFSTCKQAKK